MMVGLQLFKGELEGELSRVEAEHRKTEQKMKRELASLERALDRSEEERKALAAAPELPIQFRTDSSDIEQHYQDQLAGIADLVADRPDVQIRLSGFADRRGSAEYNQRLSEARVQEVKKYLMSHGVSVRQIAAQAYGESRPVKEEETAENNFFDRRVVMKFVPADESVAAR
ncbi:MAG: OmpA family protein [Pseudomonadales bacterium]|nr:OmpA family protein [Pseudomonadales bacterium]